MDEKTPVTKIRIGPAGWSYKDWAGIVYPKRKPAGFHEATYLATYFDTIELNVTFYRPIPVATAKEWVARVAANKNFVFTAKLWKEFTHNRDLSAANELAFRPAMEALRDAGKLGALLAQFPWSFKNEPDNLNYLNKLVERFREFPFVVEVRHGSWDKPEVYEWFADRGVGFCNIDQPVIGRSMQPSDRTTAPVGYVRLHGRRYDTWFSHGPDALSSERYNYLYSAEELNPWLKRIQNIAQTGESAFVITNNHYEGKAIVNALQLVHRLTKRPVDAPRTLVERYSALEAICNSSDSTPNLFRNG
jgi:uncharacterized protein YecE (DUF72 family)